MHYYQAPKLRRSAGPLSAEHEALDYKPLYARIRDRLVGRLVDGQWTPGMLIPSEMELARQLGVSQGTVRKALDVMASENLLVRRQGRGTYVAVPEEGPQQFKFFRLLPDDGSRVLPESEVVRRRSAKASAMEAKMLKVPPDSQLWTVERVRFLGEEPLLVETIILPAARFPGFDEVNDLPNNIYGLYAERWGVTISAASEKLKAVAAEKNDAELLGCALGDPLIQIERIGYDLENTPSEIRVSRCNTRNAHYVSVVR
jgi:GntR family transcriptional regulator